MPNRPQPAFPEPNTQEYWEGVKAGELRYQVCNTCNNVVFTPKRHCDQCGSTDLSTKVSKGEGEVYTYSVVRQSGMPGFREMGAYTVAYVDLDEGFRVLTSIVGAADPTKDISIGDRVKVEFEQQDSGEYPIPVFRQV